MKKTAAICGAFLMAAGLSAAQVQQQQDQEYKVDFTKHINGTKLTNIFSLPLVTSSGTTAVNAGYEVMSLIAKDANGNLAQCNSLRIMLEDKTLTSVMKAAGVTLSVSSESIADMMRLGEKDDPEALFSYGSCVPYETVFSAAEKTILDDKGAGGREWEAFKSKEALLYEPVMVTIYSRRGTPLFRQDFDMTKDPARESRFKTPPPPGAGGYPPYSTPCKNTGYIDAVNGQAIKLRVCPNP